MTTSFGFSEKAKVLVIGHDPRLLKSLTLADHSFFANYFFKPIPTKRNEYAKYKLAEAVYSYIHFITNYKYKSDELYITNLCNDALPPVKNKTVYISKEKAEKGLLEIKNVLAESKIELIFAMSQQVNYWMQKLDFYNSNNDFLKKAEPKLRGVNANPPYYLTRESEAFRLICAKKYKVDEKHTLIPILHVKNWPLKSSFERVYEKSYIQLINELK